MLVAFLLCKIVGGDLIRINIVEEYFVIRTIKDNEKHLINDDPIRPHISFDDRMGQGRNVLVLEQDGEVGAVVCTALVDQMPTDEEELFKFANPQGGVVVPYTVWSYKKGCGRIIINQLRESALEEHCFQLVTLSPKTDMAEKFHISNGAKCVSRNESSNNFEYSLV